MTDAAPPAGRSALLLGATGLVGGHVLELLLDDPATRRVVVLARRPSGRAHPKLEERIGPLEGMEAHAADFAADAVFCCLGTTIRAAGSREAFRRVDHGYPVAAARLAAARGAGAFLLVSAAGADARSRIFYNQVKGEAERDVAASGVPRVVILRPSLLLGHRDENRPGEAIAQKLLPRLSPLLVGPLRRYRAIDARAVARAMVRLGAGAGAPGVRIVESDEIQEIGR